ncbi:MAG: Flp family type IVb pilin [Acidimicrobiia bacterium]
MSAIPEPEKEPGHDRGASLVEYALLLALVVLAAVASLDYFGGATGGSLDRSGSEITSSFSD